MATLWSYRSLGTPQRPPLVFLHGFLGSGSDWMEIARRCENRFFCIMPDLPGHGRNTKLSLDDPLDFDVLAQGLATLFDALNLDSVNLVGYSMGGRIALHTATKFPERIHALVLESCHPGLEAGERQQRATLDCQRAEDLLSEGIDLFVDRWYQADLFQTLRRHLSFPSLKVQRKRNNAAWMAKIIQELSPAFQPALWEKLESLPLPVLLVAGALDEKYSNISKRMKEKIPTSQTNIIAEAGHNAHFEAPEAFVKSLIHFFEKLIRLQYNESPD